MSKKPLNIILVFVSLFLPSLNINAQIYTAFPGGDGCGFEDTTTQSSNWSKVTPSCNQLSSLFSDLNWYRPDATTPVKTIRLNFVFMQRNDGTGGWQENDPVHQQYWTDVINRLNTKFANFVDPPTFCTSGVNSQCESNDFIQDSKIQFVVNRMYFQNTVGWDNEPATTKLCPTGNSWYLDFLDDQIRNDQTIEPALSLFFTEEGTYFNDVVINGNCAASQALNLNCSHLANIVDLNGQIRVHIRNSFTNYVWSRDCAPAQFGQPWDPVIREWSINTSAGSLAHEIGHCFFPTINHCNNCLNPNPANTHVMNQCGTCPRNYLATQNIENIHRTIAISNMRRFVDNCSATTELEISTNEFLDFDVKLYRNLRILPGGNLDIDCRLVTPQNSAITIEDQGTLTINTDAIFEPDCNSCLGLYFNVSGELNIYSSLFQFPENSVLQVNSTGIVNINNLAGLCVNNGILININPGGVVNINGQNYTSILADFNNDYNVFLNSTDHTPKIRTGSLV